MSDNDTDCVSEGEYHYLIASKDHFYIVQQSDVIFDERTGLNVGDMVKFTYGKSDYNGKILHSGDYEAMVSKSKEIQKQNQKRKPVRDPSFYEGKPRKAAIQQKERMKKLMPLKTKPPASDAKTKGKSVKVTLKKNLEAKQSMAATAVEEMINVPSTSKYLPDDELKICDDAKHDDVSSSKAKTEKPCDSSPSEMDYNSSDSKSNGSSESVNSGSNSWCSSDDSQSEGETAIKIHRKKKNKKKMEGKHSDLVHLKSLTEGSKNYSNVTHSFVKRKGTERAEANDFDATPAKRKKLETGAVEGGLNGISQQEINASNVKPVQSVATLLKKRQKHKRVKEDKCHEHAQNKIKSEDKIKFIKNKSRPVMDVIICEEGETNQNSHQGSCSSDKVAPIMTLAELINSGKDKNGNSEKGDEESSEEGRKSISVTKALEEKVGTESEMELNDEDEEKADSKKKIGKDKHKKIEKEDKKTDGNEVSVDEEEKFGNKNSEEQSLSQGNNQSLNFDQEQSYVEQKPENNVKTRAKRNLTIYPGQNYRFSKSDPNVIKLHEKYEVYVAETVADDLSKCKSATGVVRALLSEVYTTEVLVNATPQGFPPRGKGQVSYANSVVPPRYHPHGLKAIKAVAIDMEKANKSWRPKCTDATLNNAISSRACKIKSD